MALSVKIEKRLQRKKRVRSKVRGLSKRPRLSVFRSNKHIFVQIIDDEKGKTLISASDIGLGKTDKQPKKNMAFAVGEDLAKKAIGLKIKNVVFDKSGYKYHGRVKEIADGARKGGLQF